MDEKEEFQVYDDIDGSAGMDAEELFSIFPQFLSLFFFIQVYDIDGSGGIDAEELSRISESLGTVISPGLV
jgi:Ca2+-binding EF-hand superfamily protein